MLNARHTKLTVLPKKSAASLLAGLAFCFVVEAALPGRAHAQVQIYTSPSSYQAASTGNTTYTFSAPSGGTNAGPSYTRGPLTFGADTLILFNNGAYGNGVTYLAGGGTSSGVTVTLSGASALSFTFGTASGAETVSISINGAPAYTFSEAGGAPNTMFIGITDTVPITTLTYSNLTNASNEIDVINFQVGSAVPEPATWLGGALLLGGAGLTLGRRLGARMAAPAR